MAKVKVQLLVSRQGPTVNQNVGDIVEVTTQEADNMVRAAQAIMVRTKAKAKEKTVKE